MKKTLVLVVDRDDDFGVKGKVNTPVIGVQNCLDAATAFGIADPEDSDLNALYAAVSVCLDLQEEGHEADVALICGDEKVGHRSDLALVKQLDEVLDEIQPESVVLVGDGAEDEYIYPIISSRAHVDSVKKVFVKQAPGLEGTFYILTKMMSSPEKRMRFLVPLGLTIIILSLFFLIPEMVIFAINRDLTMLSSMSGPLVIFFVGLVLALYGFNVVERMYDMRGRIKVALVGKTTSIIFFALAMTVIIAMALYSYMGIEGLYINSFPLKVVYFVSTMVWPFVIAFVLMDFGTSLETFIHDKTINTDLIFSCLGLASLGLATTGILDLLMMNMGYGYGWQVGILEIASGIALSVLVSIIKSKYGKIVEQEFESDEVA